MVNILIAVIVILIYSQLKGTMIEVVVKRKWKYSIYVSDIYISLTKLFDICITFEIVMILLNGSIYYHVLMTLFLTSSIKSKIDSIERKSTKHLSNELIKLMIESYYHLSIGSRFDYFILEIKDNDLIDYILKHKEPLELRIAKLSRSIQMNEFNRFMALIRRMDYFDSDKILYELESLIQMVLSEQFSSNKKYAEKMNELSVFPMAINLINMSLMLVYPYLKEWF